MSVFEALILGVVQGATEFLPVSSSGHLVLLRKLFGIDEPAMLYDAAVHGGTLIAVLVVLRQDILNILRRVFQPMTLYLIIATIPVVIAALVFEDQIEEAYATGTVLGFTFLVTSALLFSSDKLYKRSAGPTVQPARFQGEMTFKDALFIGLFQAAAILPGISRSGSTISAGLFRRFDRDFAARFAFLLSIPAIMGALVFQAKEIVTGEASPSAIGLLPIAVGTISACIVAFFAIRFAMKMVRERSLKCFAVYTGVLGILILIDKFGTNFFF